MAKLDKAVQMWSTFHYALDKIGDQLQMHGWRYPQLVMKLVHFVMGCGLQGRTQGGDWKDWG